MWGADCKVKRPFSDFLCISALLSGRNSWDITEMSFHEFSILRLHTYSTTWGRCCDANGPCFQPIRICAATRPLRFRPLLSITLVLRLLMSRERSYRVSGSEEDGGRRSCLAEPWWISERWSDCRSIGVVQSAEVCVARAISLYLKWETQSLSVSGDWHQIRGTGASVALHANNLAFLCSVCLSFFKNLLRALSCCWCTQFVFEIYTGIYLIFNYACSFPIFLHLNNIYPNLVLT